MGGDFLYGIGEGWLTLIVLGLFYLFAEIGFRLGVRSSSKIGEAAASHVATVEGALLGLLALLLGFAFSMAMTRYENRRSVIVAEANDISTTSLRARLLPEERGKIVMPLLRDYVDSRIRFFQAGLDHEMMQRTLGETETIQNKLWNEAVLAARQNSDEVTTGYFIESLNSLIDDHTERVAATENHVPEVILLLLIFVGSMSLAMTGYSSGLNKTRLVIPRSILVLLTGATLMVIIDLDRPRRGFITISQNALLKLQEEMQIGKSQ